MEGAVFELEQGAGRRGCKCRSKLRDVRHVHVPLQEGARAKADTPKGVTTPPQGTNLSAASSRHRRRPQETAI